MVFKMKKCVYLLANDSFQSDKKGVGVFGKIISQVHFFEDKGYECDIVNLLPPLGNPIKKFVFYLKSDLYKEYLSQVGKDIDFLYIRHIYPSNAGVVAFLKKIRNSVPAIKIIYEIPTYPYDNETEGLKEKIALKMDKHYRKKLKKYIDVIATYSNDKTIWGIQTLQIQNGVDCSTLPVVQSRDNNSNRLNLIAVAQFSPWHGYDRLIEGLRLYRRNQNGKYNITVDFVGNGPLLDEYKKLVEKYNLNNVIHFHGLKSGQELTAVFNTADMGVCSLGCHRKKVFLSSELKSREYLARGLPIVTSTKIDVIPNVFPYCLRVPEDDSPIDMTSIISFYESNIKNKSQDYIHHEVRKFAEEKCDMKVVMQPILDFVEKHSSLTQ